MNKRGQSIIEYVLIAVLVILGVVIMGPYVLRSVGAHFKLWDEGVQDSFTENLTQAPVNDVPYISTNCNCTGSTINPDTSSGCGNGQAGSQCGANQSIWNHSCNPQLCDGAPASYCKNDSTCCTAWVNIGCGTIPIGQTPPSNNCNYGYEIQGQQCGSNNTVQCTPNSNCPLPACLGVVTQGATACPGTTTGLTQNYGITYVQEDSQANCANLPNCTYCNPNQKCEYYLGNPPIKCLYNGTPFSGVYDGNFEGQCALWTNVPICSGRSGGESDAEKSLVFFCANNYLTGWCDHQISTYREPAGYRGININLSSLECSPYGGTASDIVCTGISGSQTYYWENSHGMSSCFDGNCSCGSFAPIPVCNWGGNFACYPQSCSNDSFTINCDATGHLENITINNIPTSSSSPAPMHGCNWSGAQTLYDFGGGNDMIWTCNVSNGQGVLTQVEFTPLLNNGCSVDASSSC